MAEEKFQINSNDLAMSFSEQEGGETLRPVMPDNDLNLSMAADDSQDGMRLDLTDGNHTMSTNTDANPHIIGEHKNLAGRDIPNQHPIAAITGLQGALDDLEDYADTAAAGALSDAKDYADTVAANALSSAELLIQEQADADTLRYNNLRLDVNGLYSEVGIIQNDMNTMSTTIEQTAQAITLKANASDVQSQFQIQAGQISTLVTTTNGHTTQIQQQADQIESLAAAIEGADGQAYLELSTRITQNANAITSEATRATNAESALSSRIQTAEGIIQTISRTNTVLNLLPFVYMSEGARGNPCTINGVTFTVNADGTVTATGTATDTVRYFLASTLRSNSVPPVSVDPLQDYFLSGCKGNGSDNYYLFARATPANTEPSGTSGTTYIDNGDGVLIPAGNKYIAVEIRVKNGYTIDQTFEPMLEVGDTAHAYQSTHQGTYATLSQIKQTADAISAEVTRATNNEASLSSRIQTANGIIQTVKSTVSNLSVGSRNILLKSATKHIALQGNATGTFTDGVSIADWGCSDAMRLNGTGGDTLTIGYLTGVSVVNPSVDGGKYIHSVYIRNRRSNDALIIANNLGQTETVPGGAIKRVVLYGTGNGSNNLLIGFRTSAIGGRFDFDWWHPQIEIGNVVTDWSPAPEDIEVRVESTESTISQLSNKISLVVERKNNQDVINAASIVLGINDAGSSVVIDADHVSLQGKTIDLTSDNIVISSYNFNVTNEGLITANAGFIAGWQIDGSKIFKDVTIDGVDYSPRLYAPSEPNINSRAFYVKRTAGNQEDFPFSVRYSGKLEATDADISGKISATSGNIAGLTINADGLYKSTYAPSGNGMQYQQFFYMPDAASGDNLAYRVRAREYTNGTPGAWVNNFFVRYDGHMVARDAEVTGTIHATNGEFTGTITSESGSIAGWDIGSTLLSKTYTANNTNYQAYIQSASSATTRAFGVQTKASSASAYTSQFYVQYNGKLFARDAVITGDITANSLDISNATITGYLSANNIASHSISVGKLTGNITNGDWKIDLDNGTMTIGKISAGKISSGTLDADRIGSRTITAGKIASNTITANEIAARTITANEIAANTITANQIAGNTITANEIAADAITVNKIKAGEITADRINVGQNDGQSARKVEWLTKINQAISVAISEGQSFRIGDWRAYGYQYSLTFGRAAGGHFVRFLPGGKLVYQNGHNEEPAWGHTAYFIWFDGTNYRGLCDSGTIYTLDAGSIN